MKGIADVLLESYQIFFDQLAIFLPKFIGAIIILIVGWLIARIVRSLSIRALRLIRLDVVTEKAGIEKFLHDGGSQKTAIDIVGSLFYWLILLIVILAAINTLGLRVASQLFNEVILFIPNIIVAVLLLMFGLFLANFVAQIVTTYLKNIEVKNTETIRNIIRYAICFFVVSMCLTQLNIGEEIVRSAFLILFGSICLALALAFGIGGKEWAAKTIKEYLGK